MVKLFIGCFVIFFLCFGFLFGKTFSYIFCPLSKYKGNIGRGKSLYFIIIHAILSIPLCILSFSFLYNFKAINALFDNDIIRISSFLLLWLVWLFVVGLLIEKFLVNTDEEYKSWKEEYLKKT